MNEIITPLIRRFCETCKREFSPAQPQIRLCSDCGGPLEAPASRQKCDTVRIYDQSEVIASEIILSPDGKHAFVKSGEYPEEGPFDYHGVPIEWSLGIWDLDRFTRTWSCRSFDMMHTMEKGLAITQDGRFALTGGRFELILWNLNSGEQKQKYLLDIPNHYLAVAVCITPDETRIIAGDNRGSVWLWDLVSGVRLCKLDCESNPITHMVLLSTGDLITVAALGDLRIWRLSSGECLGVQHTRYEIPAAILTRDEQLLFSTRGGSILQWNPLAAGPECRIERESTLHLVYQGEAGCAAALTLTPDGSAILVGGNDGVLRLIELSTGHCLGAWRPPAEYAHYIDCLAIAPDGRRALVGAGNQLHLWEWKEPLGSTKEFIERQPQTIEKDEVESLRQEILIDSTIPAHCRKCKKDLTAFANSDGRGAELQEVVTHLCPECAVLEDKTAGKRIGDYLLLQWLGQSGFSRTYRSWHSPTCREVMLEEIEKSRDQDIYLKRLFQIAQHLMKFIHPNLLRLIHADEESGILIWELFSGETAGYTERAGSTQSFKEALEIGILTLSGLEYLHNQGWVHRNIQPHSLRVKKAADRVLVKIAEFNFIFNPEIYPEAEKEVLVAGAMRFISPEDTLHFNRFKQPGDLYSLGASLYYMLTGMYVMHPYHEVEPVLIRERDPSIPSVLALVVDKAVSKKVENRYQTAAEFKAALKAVLDVFRAEEEILDTPVTPISVIGKIAPEEMQSAPFKVTCFFCGNDGEDLSISANSDGRAAELEGKVLYLCPAHAEKMMTKPSRNINQYHLLKHTGVDEEFQKYVAWHAPTRRRVRIWVKNTPEDHDVGEGFLTFEARMQLLQHISHPNIVKVIGVEKSSEGMIYILDYPFPENLESILEEQGGKFSIEKTIACSLDLLDGLAYLHEQGYVHRDVNPGNLILVRTRSASRVELACFNLLRGFKKHLIDEDGDSFFGELPYMPIEQVINFYHCKPPVDLYAVGVTIYYLLTGEYSLPFPNRADQLRGNIPGKDPIRIILEDKAIPILQRNPEIPERLAQVIDKAVRKNAAERYQSAMDLKRDLLDAMGWSEQRPQRTIIPIQPAIEELSVKDTSRPTITCSIFNEDISSQADSDGRARELLGDVIYWCPRCLLEVSIELPQTQADTPSLRFIKTTDNLHWLPSASRLAWQSTTGRVLVVKQVAFKPDAQDDLHCFVQHLETIRDIRHPNLTRLVEYQSSENTVWLSSAFVPSNNLWDEIIPLHDRPIGQIVRSMTGLLNGLEMMHVYGYPHLNIHPWNVLIPTGNIQNPKLCLSDLLPPGASSMSQPTGIRNDPKANIEILFLPPERITDWKNREPVSDIYALGQIFYFMLTAKLPFDVKIDREMKLRKDPIKLVLDKKRISILDCRPDLPAELARVVDRAVDPDKKRRFQSTAEFKRALVELWKIL